MRNNVLVLYHADCTDGFTSAWLVWRKYYGYHDLEFRPVRYQEPAPTADEVRGRVVYILDFSYTREQVYDLCGTAEEVVLLDHHKSMAETWGLDPNRSHLLQSGNLTVRYEPKMSGAGLTWNHLNGKHEPPRLVQYVQDRDLWLFKLPGSRKINDVIQHTPKTFTAFEDLYHKFQGSQVTILDLAEGCALVQSNIIRQLVTNARRQKFLGRDCAVVNSSVLHSELADEFREECAVVIWHMSGNGKIKLSFRSSKELDVDVSEMAKLLGGGGHRHAAGASCTVEAFLKLLDGDVL